MAGKKKNEDPGPVAEDIPAVDGNPPPLTPPAEGGESSTAEAAPTGPPDGDYCILVNLTKDPLDCALRSGINVPLGPRVRGLNIHRSKPVLKKERTPLLFKWEKQGRIAFEPVPGGESA